MFVVYLCGPTDCFPHAAFVDREKAKEWAIQNSDNPEGYLIKHENIANVPWEESF